MPVGRAAALSVRKLVLMKPSNLDDINVLEILDRVLDNGIVVDPSARVVLMGNALDETQSHLVVESLRYLSLRNE